MKLWLLRPRDGRPDEGSRDKDPWEPWYDKAFGFVVRASTEEIARKVAAEEARQEAHESDGKNPWLDAEQATCTELTADGEPGVVIEDVHAA